MQKVTQKFFKTAGGISDDQGCSIVTNEKGVFVTGFVSGVTALDFKKQVRHLQGVDDIFVAGLDHNGCQKFFKTAGGINADAGFSIATNEKGVFITGRIRGDTALDFKNNEKVLQGADDIFVAGLDYNGCQKFFKTAGGKFSDIGLSIATNEKGVFVTGYVSGVTALDFKNKVINLSNPSSQGDIFVAGLDHNGCQKFFKTAGGISEDQGVSITTNEKGVFVTGSIRGDTAVDFKKKVIYLSGSGDIFVAGLDHNGCQKFFKTAGGKLTDEGLSIATNEKGVFVTGRIRGDTALDFKKNVKNLSGGGDIFVAGLDHNGCQKFFKTAGGKLFAQGLSIATNEKGVFVTGEIRGVTALDFKKNVKNLSGSGDIFVAGLDHNGCQKFFKTAGGKLLDQGVSIATNEKGVFVTGYVNGDTALDFKKKVRNLSGSGDIFVAELDHNGCQKFFKTAGGMDFEQGNSIVANEKEVFVTGYVSGDTTLDFKGNERVLQGTDDIFVAGLDLGIKSDRILGKGFRSKMPYV